MKVIIFGTGVYYKKRKEEIKKISNVKIVAFLDNNSNKWGKREEGIQIVSPIHMHKFDYDEIILMSASAREMKEQLLMLGIESTKIKYWEQFRAEVMCEKIRIINPLVNHKKYKKEILIISVELNYNGGSIAAIYMAKALQKKGYSVIMAVPRGNQKLIDEIIVDDMSIAICPSIPYLQKEDLEWIKQFDMVFVNVFQMIKCACDISEICPTLWWIHEPPILYDSTLRYFEEYVDEAKMKNISVYPVSKIAEKNFKSYISYKKTKILNYGIPDMYFVNQIEISKCSTTIFAIIGGVCELKAQDIFIKAIEEMKFDNFVEFWIIGNMGNDEYCNNIRKAAEQNPSIKIMGMLTRKEIYNVFPKIDVVVCPSREDCLPIVMTEAMMFGKICIASEGTGTADFITDGENGFIVPVEDVHALSDKMDWIVENKSEREHIGKNARKTYEKYFSMEVFGDNLEKALLETEKFWNANKNL